MKYLIAFTIIIPISNFAQLHNSSSLQLKEIMKGDEFIGHQPENIEWSIDGKCIYFDWNPENNPVSSLYFYDLHENQIQRFDTINYSNRIPFVHTEYDVVVYSKEGNLYKYDNKKNYESLIIKNSSFIHNIQQWKDKVYFQIDDGIYLYDLKNQSVNQIANFDKGKKPEKVSPNYLENQEMAHFQFLIDDEISSEFRKTNKLKYEEDIPVIYTNGLNFGNVQVSPDGGKLIYRLDITPKDPRTNVPNFIGKNGQVETINARSKVSPNDPNHELHVFDLHALNDIIIDFSALSDIRKKPTFLKDYGDSKELYDNDRNIIMHEVIWNPSGTSNILDVRSYDNKDRWLVHIDLETGSVQVIEHQHDEAWIGGPGISSWNMVSGTLDWLQENIIYFQSEETGYSHLYSLDLSTGRKTALTSGSWEVHDIVLSKDKSKFYITANKTHPGNREFYHLDLKSKKLIPILSDIGNYEVSISPDETKLAVRFSTKTDPWELFICDNKVNSKLAQITNSTTKAFQEYPWYDPKVIQFKASDGENVYARLYEPESESKNGAAVIFVHGAGYLQNAHNYWSGYHREFMFHNLLRDNGYTVLDIDYRASAGYGRDHRTAIYRFMGGKDLSDQIDGKKLICDSLGIDPSRVGIYGGSYGGFITLMALLTEPGEFACGAALRSVTDWNHYNHEYTSNILNYPTTDSLAYARSSPINYAENLSDPLLMLHGMVDDNVQFQDVIRLSQKFIESGKVDWELAVFPVEAHGFKRADSWTDEYRRIFELFEKHLLK